MAFMLLVPLGSNPSEWRSHPEWHTNPIGWLTTDPDRTKLASDLSMGDVVIVHLGQQQLACARLLLRAGAALTQRQSFKLVYACSMLQVPVVRAPCSSVTSQLIFVEFPALRGPKLLKSQSLLFIIECSVGWLLLWSHQVMQCDGMAAMHTFILYMRSFVMPEL